eukprot:scaffold1.g5529.t1
MPRAVPLRCLPPAPPAMRMRRRLQRQLQVPRAAPFFFQLPADGIAMMETVAMLALAKLVADSMVAQLYKALSIRDRRAEQWAHNADEARRGD